MTSIAGVHSPKAITHDWITPKHVIDGLGGYETFDLDPCQSATQPWPCAKAGVLFLQGRLHFHFPDGRRAPHNSGGPSCLVAYGKQNARALCESGLLGKYVDLGVA